MVARGDLGVELPFEEVPLVQKRMIHLANQAGRPVITATQMLESMIEHPRPTRAEASDVANAIIDGTDAVMLSAETASGAYPELSVEAMRRIIAEIERHHLPSLRDERRASHRKASTEETIAAATVTAVRMLGAALVVVFTKSGFTARMVSSQRPDVPILASHGRGADLSAARSGMGGDSGAGAAQRHVRADVRARTRGTPAAATCQPRRQGHRHGRGAVRCSGNDQSPQG